MDKTCCSCNYWSPTGEEDSGIRASSGEGNWIYRVGVCEAPERFNWTTIAEWRPICHLFRRRRKESKP